MATLPLDNTGYRTGNLQATDVDAAALAAELRARVAGEVRFDDGSRAMYSTDGSNYRQVPIGVVIPAPLRTWPRRWRPPAATARRCWPVAAAPAWQASAVMSPS